MDISVCWTPTLVHICNANAAQAAENINTGYITANLKQGSLYREMLLSFLQVYN